MLKGLINIDVYRFVRYYRSMKWWYSYAKSNSRSGSSINNYVTVSLGVATISPQLEQTAKELVFAADRAMYEAKQNGRNRISAVRLG
jgi:diguanylate cyclase (GGDEF)-like protein